MIDKLLICTDLDRTLLPNGKQPESAEARSMFARLVNRPEVSLADVSGGHRDLVQAAIWEYQLLTPSISRMFMVFCENVYLFTVRTKKI